MSKIQNEEELFQIVRFHNSDIKTNIKFSADYGVPSYSVEMDVCGRKFNYWGANLYKRYAEMIKTLTEIYGENLYEYDKKPIK